MPSGSPQACAIVWLCLSMLAPAVLRCQHPQALWFHSLSAKEGLSQGYNWYVHHDSEGFAWVSSVSGLYRFDGLNTREYLSIRDDTTSLLGETIHSRFFEDRNSDMWFSTPEAIHVYRRKQDHFRRFFLNDEQGRKIPGDYTVQFLEKDSLLWVSTGYAIYRMDKNKPELAATHMLDTEHFRYRFMTRSDGSVSRMYAFGLASGLLIYTMENGKPVSRQSSGQKKALFFPNDLIMDVLPVSDSLVWVLSDQRGLFAWNPQKDRALKSWPEFAGHSGCLAPWKQGMFILVSRGKGVFVVDGAAFNVLPVTCHFIEGETQAIHGFKFALVDADDNLWITDETRGVLFANLKKTKFNSLPKFPATDNTNNYNFWALQEDWSGNVWVATVPAGLFQLNASGAVMRHFRNRPGDPGSLPSDWVRGLLVDHKNQLWVATAKGMARMNTEKGIFYPVADQTGKSDYIMNFVYQTRERDILAVSEESGVFEVVHAGGQDKLVNLLPGDQVSYQSIFQGTDGLLYCIRNYNEMCVFSKHGNTLVLRDSFPLDGMVNALYENKTKNITYLATSNGLLKFAQHAFNTEPAVLSEPEGLPGKFIKALLPDAAQNLWISTNKGLALMWHNTDSIHAFVLADGVQSTEFDQMVALKRKNGELWFAGNNGITIVPAGFAFSPTTPLPKTVITGIKINDKVPDNVVCRRTGASNITQIRELSLPFSENTLSFEFVAIEYSAPANNRLQYRMAEKDDFWLDVNEGETGFARYPKLMPGTYTFWLRAANSDGVWGPPVQTLTIHIRPPWYLSWWFLTLSALIVLGGLYALYRNRVNRIRREADMKRREAEIRQKEAEFKQKEAETKQQIAEFETAVLRLQMNPHFIFNSMNSINSYILKKDIDTASDYLGRFAGLMRTILNLAAKPYISVADEIRFLRQYLLTEAMRFEKKFDFFIETDKELDLEDTIIPTMILQPFVENAIWHGLDNKAEAGMIWIRFEKDQQRLVCSVEDNGVGRESARQLKEGAEHVSKALTITRQRLQLLEAEKGVATGFETIDLVEPDGQPAGTKVTLTLPLL